MVMVAAVAVIVRTFEAKKNGANSSDFFQAVQLRGGRGREGKEEKERKNKRITTSPSPRQHRRLPSPRHQHHVNMV
jgi:hypothetical protein